MSAPTAPAPPQAAGDAPAEACPLCGAPLASDQEWCLRCGAAARTRLAAAPGWKGPIVALAVVAALALGVLAAALVKLAGDSGPAPAPVTHTVTGAATTPTVATAPTVATSPTSAVPPVTTPAQPGSSTATPTAPATGASAQGTPAAPGGGGAATNTNAGKNAPGPQASR